MRLELAPAGLSYNTPAPVYAAGMAITPDNPTVNPLGGAPTSYSVIPDLSQTGLTLDPSTGVLSGTPVAVPSTITPPPPFTATFTVTALQLQRRGYGASDYHDLQHASGRAQYGPGH